MQETKKRANFLDLPYDTGIFSSRIAEGKIRVDQAKYKDGLLPIISGLEAAEDQLSELERVLEEGLSPQEVKSLKESNFNENFKKTLWPKLGLAQQCYEIAVKLQVPYEIVLSIREQLEVLKKFLPVQKIKAYQFMQPYFSEAKKNDKTEEASKKFSFVIEKITELQLRCDTASQLCDQQWVLYSCEILKKAARILYADNSKGLDEKESRQGQPKPIMLKVMPNLSRDLESFVDTTTERRRVLSELGLDKKGKSTAKFPPDKISDHNFGAVKPREKHTVPLVFYEVIARLKMFETILTGVEKISPAQMRSFIKAINSAVKISQAFSDKLNKNIPSPVVSFFQEEIGPCIDTLAFLGRLLNSKENVQHLLQKAKTALQAFTPAAYEEAFTCLDQLNKRNVRLTAKDYKKLDDLLTQAQSRTASNPTFFSTNPKILDKIGHILQDLRGPAALLSPLEGDDLQFNLFLGTR